MSKYRNKPAMGRLSALSDIGGNHSLGTLVSAIFKGALWAKTTNARLLHYPWVE